MSATIAAPRNLDPVGRSVDDPRALLAEARNQFEKGNLAESERLYNQAVPFNETAADACYGLGLIYLKNENAGAAKLAFEASVKRSPQNANAYYYLGQIWEKQGSREAALGFFKSALQIDPRHYGAQREVATLSHAELRPSQNPPHHDEVDALKDPDPIQQSSRATSALPDGSSFGITAVLKNDPNPLSKEVLRALTEISMNVTPRLSAFAGPLLRRFLILFIYLALSGIVANKFLILTHANKASASTLGFIFNVIIPAAGLLLIFAKILHVKTTSIAIDQGRVRISSGILSRKTHTAELYRVEDLELDQSFINRLTDDGTITLHTKEKGKSTSLKLVGIAPIGKLRNVFDQMRNLVLMLRTGPWGKGVVW